MKKGIVWIGEGFVFLLGGFGIRSDGDGWSCPYDKSIVVIGRSSDRRLGYNDIFSYPQEHPAMALRILLSQRVCRTLASDQK